MIAGVLAAGSGERLRQGGIATPKPLVEIAGMPLVCHALAAVTACGAEHAVVAVNEEAAEAVDRTLAAVPVPVPITIVKRTTASSLETFSLVAMHLLEMDRRSPALISMVDGVFSPTGLDCFSRAAACEAFRCGGEGLLAVTRDVEDERPLCVAFGRDGLVSAIGSAAGGSRFSTAGLYLLPASVLAGAERAREQGMTALREFLAVLPGGGVRLRAIDVGPVADVDCVSDIATAERVARGRLED